MSQATLVSLVPFPINEWKPGIYPGFFEIPASKNDIPQLLTIGDSVYHVEIDENRSITVKCQAEEIARSVVDDYVISNLQYSAEDDAAPGFFWKSGKHDLGSILKNFQDDVKLAKERQRRWFVRLVKLADDDWERSRQHKAISDIQRYAAKALTLERPWIIKPQEGENGLVKCIACQSLILSEAVVCPNCKMIRDEEKWKTFKFANT